ncbi:MAG: sigma 54-interacting transcriptional regulator [Syntrophomonadaceae bacterium]|nr:sigma 54-interacting transcriptional regulator [Syntrophomonadaceae bacterium]
MANKDLTSKWKALHKNPVLRDKLPSYIKDSWERSIQCRIDPGMRENPYIVQGQDLIKAQKTSQFLIEVALPVMKNLYEFVAGTGFVVTLADANLCVLKVIGDSESQAWAEQARLVEGSLWSENLVGTNAGGLAFDLARPVSVIGHEHFCLFSHVSASSSAPIIHQGRIIGGLAMVAPFERVSNHTLGMVVASVKHIESIMVLKRNTQYTQLLIDSISEGVMAVDTNGTITYLNQAAARTFGLTEDLGSGRNVYDVLGNYPDNHNFINTITQGRHVVDETHIINLGHTSIKCNITCNPLNTPDPSGQGTVVLIRESQRMNRLVRNWIGMEAKMTFDDIIGSNDKFQKVIHTAQSASASVSNVLLLGESGTGKDIIAQAMHNASSRSRSPFLAINCAAIPRELIASELFGYEEGAFTGAKKGGNIGKFELADQGTLFLDEIGDMPLDLQASLLRVIEEKNVLRLGGNKLIPVDVRIVTATNKDLEAEMNRGRFRRDLYYRLGVIRIHIPPLRERPEDISLLTKELSGQICDRCNKPRMTIAPEVLKAFLAYEWPGNVREMQNVLEGAVQMAQGTEISLDLIRDHFSPTVKELAVDAEHTNDIAWVEKQMIVQYLKKYQQNKTRTAQALGISRQTLYRRLQEYGL